MPWRIKVLLKALPRRLLKRKQLRRSNFSL
jgi:hypothetical protein